MLMHELNYSESTSLSSSSTREGTLTTLKFLEVVFSICGM
jgi:hypothetical protein